MTTLSQIDVVFILVLLWNFAVLSSQDMLMTLNVNKTH